MRFAKPTFKRKPKRRVVSRSFRLPPEMDRQLDAAAAKRQWTKSFLVRDIIISWLRFQAADKVHEGNDPGGLK